jgi:hypothetical protein
LCLLHIALHALTLPGRTSISTSILDEMIGDMGIYGLGASCSRSGGLSWPGKGMKFGIENE